MLVFVPNQIIHAHGYLENVCVEPLILSGSISIGLSSLGIVGTAKENFVITLCYAIPFDFGFDKN